MKKNNKGQVIVEYVLLTGLVLAIFVGVYNRFKDFVDDPEGGARILSPFNALDKDQQYRKYRIIK